MLSINSDLHNSNQNMRRAVYTISQSQQPIPEPRDARGLGYLMACPDVGV